MKEEYHAVQESHIPGAVLVFDPLEDPASDPEEGKTIGAQLVPDPGQTHE